METPRSAQEMAAAALTRISAPARAHAEIPARIAAGGFLSPSDVEVIADFWSQPQQRADPSWQLAAALLGGETMRRAILAAPQPAGSNAMSRGVMVAGVIPAYYADALAVGDGLPPSDLHVTLAYIGSLDEDEGLDELVRIELTAVVDAIAAQWYTVPVEFTHQAHLGSGDAVEVAVALEAHAPTLHQLRRDLVGALDRAGIPWSDRFAYRPHMTVTWLPRSEAEAQWPEGPLDKPVTAEIGHLLLSWGALDHTAALVGAPTVPQSPTTAAAAPSGLPALDETLSSLTAALAAVDHDLAIEVRTAVQYGYTSALDRIGRMATSTAAAATKLLLRALPPAAAAIRADAELLSALNPSVGDLIAPGITDTVAQVRRALQIAGAQALSRITETFGVDLDTELADLADATDRACAYLAAALTDEVLYRAGVTTPERIDPAEGNMKVDPLVAPFGITRDVLALAGGAGQSDLLAPTRDSAGRPTYNGRAGADGVGLGPWGVAAIRSSIDAYFEADVTAAAKRRAGANISDALRSDLSKAATALHPATPRDQRLMEVVEGVWTLDMNGTTKTQHFPPHEALAGTRIVAEAELSGVPGVSIEGDWPPGGHYRPGDHRYCHCGWAMQVRLVPASGLEA